MLATTTTDTAIKYLKLSSIINTIKLLMFSDMRNRNNINKKTIRDPQRHAGG